MQSKRELKKMLAAAQERRKEAIEFLVNLIEKTCDRINEAIGIDSREKMYSHLETLCIFEDEVQEAKELLRSKKRNKLMALLSIVN
jgi:DNA repair exonuclease SbcCD ATPase subunit